MEKILVLDHGYIALVEHWGSDERVVEAARMSTGKGFSGWGPVEVYDCPTHGKVGRADTYGGESGGRGHSGCYKTVSRLPDESGDERLLEHLWRNNHATPFEMAGAVFEVKLPLFVVREWHRHRTQSYNEQSSRYTPLPDEHYLPSVDRLMMNARAESRNHQAGVVQGAAPMTESAAEAFRQGLRLHYAEAEQVYQSALASGVPKELARVHLPAARYTRMRASALLRNWLGFLSLRSTAKGPNAQWEIRQYADALHDVLSGLFPKTMTLFGGGELRAAYRRPEV